MAFGHQQSGPRKLAVSTALARCSKLVHLLSGDSSSAPLQHSVPPRHAAAIRPGGLRASNWICRRNTFALLEADRPRSVRSSWRPGRPCFAGRAPQLSLETLRSAKRTFVAKPPLKSRR